MPGRTLRTIGLVGATLLTVASAAPSITAHAAAKMVTANGDGYVLSYPSTWKHQLKVAADGFFTTPSLKHLVPTADVYVTADTVDAVIVLVKHAATSTATIKSVENSIFRDNNSKLVKPVTYQTNSQNGITFTSATTVIQDKKKTFAALVSATSYKGKTFYFLASMLVDNTAKSKKDSDEVISVLGTIALR